MAYPTTSIIILTKNRAPLLEKNLSSLQKQTIKPTEIIVVNNNSVDQTDSVIREHKRLLPIRSFKTRISGYAKLYNFGIQNSRGRLICFLDDDCLAKEDWLENLVKMHQRYPNFVIQGQTFALPKDNIYAQIMGDHYQNWLKSNLTGEFVLKVLDNKNLAVSKEIFDKYGVFSEKQNIGSEDIELGMRLRKNGVKIIFQQKAIAWHHERDNFKAFLKQHYRIAKTEALLDRQVIIQDKIGLFPKKKTWLNFKSGARRMSGLIIKRNLKNALKLPVIYLFLFSTRVLGHFTNEKS